MVRVASNTKFMGGTIDIFAICLPIRDYGRNLRYTGVFIAVTIHFISFNNLLHVSLTEFLLGSFLDMLYRFFPVFVMNGDFNSTLELLLM